jgi:hypothetical protein
MTPARRKAFDKEKRRHVHAELKRAVDAVLQRADQMYGGEPLRASYCVAVKKPRAYYAAAGVAVHLMKNYQHLLIMKSSELIQDLNTRVQARLGMDAKIDKSYWYKPLTPYQLKEIAQLMRGYDFKPHEHNQLNLIADLLRSGPSCADGTHDRPTGGDTNNGPVQFLNSKQVRLFGNDRAIRWRRDKPYVRDTSGTEHNLFTLLEGAGLDKGTAEGWMANAEERFERLRLAAIHEEQRVRDLAELDELFGDDFESEDIELAKAEATARKAAKDSLEPEDNDWDEDLLPELGGDD